MASKESIRNSLEVLWTKPSPQSSLEFRIDILDSAVKSLVTHLDQKFALLPPELLPKATGGKGSQPVPSHPTTAPSLISVPKTKATLKLNEWADKLNLPATLNDKAYGLQTYIHKNFHRTIDEVQNIYSC